MKRKLPIIGLALAFIALGCVLAFLIDGSSIPVLDPKGWVAEKQKDLLIITVLLMLIVIIPVFAMTFGIVMKYRDTNKKRVQYKPDWDHNRIAEMIWWGIPLAIIVALSVIIYRSSHELDPYKSLDHPGEEITIEVVALQWKWLFIYPEQNIASVNFVQFPEDTPISFHLTSDAPMNSFWIPQLAGQIYAMSGMTTKLHLVADEPGDYNGVSANISGEGFAKMKFVARASSREDFDRWVSEAKTSEAVLDLDTYTELARPGEVSDPILYSSRQPDLYDTIVMKYMMSDHSSNPIELDEHRGAGHH